MNELMRELEQAHLDYEKRKVKVIGNLAMLFDNTDNVIVKDILKETIEFIKEREI